MVVIVACHLFWLLLRYMIRVVYRAVASYCESLLERGKTGQSSLVSRGKEAIELP